MTEVISQREMRNNSGEVLRRVAAGESFIITNNGVEVARLTPVTSLRPKPAPHRPRTSPRGAPWPPRHRSDQTVQELLDELRADVWER